YPSLRHSFFLYCYLVHPYLHSFPTRRSSDLDLDQNYSGWCIVSSADSDHSGVHDHGLSRPEHTCCGTQAGCRSAAVGDARTPREDRKSTRLNSSHVKISYAVFCLKKKKKKQI